MKQSPMGVKENRSWLPVAKKRKIIYHTIQEYSHAMLTVNFKEVFRKRNKYILESGVTWFPNNIHCKKALVNKCASRQPTGTQRTRMQGALMELIDCLNTLFIFLFSCMFFLSVTVYLNGYMVNHLAPQTLLCSRTCIELRLLVIFLNPKVLIMLYRKVPALVCSYLITLILSLVHLCRSL